MSRVVRETRSNVKMPNRRLLLLLLPLLAPLFVPVLPLITPIEVQIGPWILLTKVGDFPGNEQLGQGFRYHCHAYSPTAPMKRLFGASGQGYDRVGPLHGQTLAVGDWIYAVWWFRGYEATR